MDATTRRCPPPPAEPTAFCRIRFLIRETEDPLADDGPHVVRNLTRSPKSISPMYVYDERGTRLFEKQCDTPEYYLRRVEARLLREHGAEIAARCGFVRLVELGAGTSDKTRILLWEYERRGRRYDYFPIDVDTETMNRTARALTDAYPHLHVHCLGTTYARGLRALPASHEGTLFLFLGSSLGNMELSDIDELLLTIYSSARPGDYLLVGADLHKSPDIINRAYNDSAGYGPASTLNMLSHLNHRYGGNFVLRNFRYRSEYRSHLRRNEVKIESLVAQDVTLTGLGVTVSFARAELVDAEIMWKFDPDQLEAILMRAGFSPSHRWIDTRYRYGLFLARRR